MDVNQSIRQGISFIEWFGQPIGPPREQEAEAMRYLAQWGMLRGYCLVGPLVHETRQRFEKSTGDHIGQRHMWVAEFLPVDEQKVARFLANRDTPPMLDLP